MRLGRLAVETVTDSIPGYKFELGKGATLRDGTDVTIIAVGMNGADGAEAAAEKLAAEGISARVIDMHTIKPLDDRAGSEGCEGDRRDRHHRRGTTSSAVWVRLWPSIWARPIPSPSSATA